MSLKKPTLDLATLETAIGHQFSDRTLLERALTHVSALKVPSPHGPHYERLEFLGDRVLGMAISDLLFRSFPEEDEGALSRRLASLVRKETCAAIAEHWGVSPYIRLGLGERQSGLRKKGVLLGDICEAIIAAIYLDAGYDAARLCVERAFGKLLHGSNASKRDAKSALQEWALAQGLPVPVYREIGRSGPDHAPLFVMAAVVEGYQPVEAEGSSKRHAEHTAAEAFLAREGVEIGG